jgi:ATP-dependent DNA ligase
MLAFTFEKQGHKIKYPCYVQPKLDGIRCIAILENGKCTLWSRTRKPITSCPHIIEEIEKNFKEDIVLDGELYSDEFKADFEHIVHLVRQEEPDPEHTDVQYHIYDTVNENTFDDRILKLTKKFASMKSPNFKYLRLVETNMVESEDQVPIFYEEYRECCFEGAILRNSAGLYVNKRSADLIKVKEMQDDEFEIVGIEEGRGKLSGHVGAFVCKIGDQEFKAKMSGATEKLKEYFEDHTLWKGKKLTVQFQDLTSYGVPRFPVGKSIRDYE